MPIKIFAAIAAVLLVVAFLVPVVLKLKDIALGVVMLMQPFSMFLYGWSFATLLFGTAMFVIVSHFVD